MAKAKRYSMEQVREAQKFLRGLAAKTSGKTRAEAVEALAADIRKAARQGYSLKEIRDVLGKAGVDAPLARMKALFDETDAGLDGKADGETAQKTGAAPLTGGTTAASDGPEKRLAASPDRDVEGVL